MYHNSGRGRGYGGRRGGRGGSRGPANAIRQAWDKLLHVTEPQVIHTEADARKFLVVLKDQAIFYGDVKAIVWQLVSTAAVAERSARLNGAQPVNGKLSLDLVSTCKPLQGLYVAFSLSCAVPLP